MGPRKRKQHGELAEARLASSRSRAHADEAEADLARAHALLPAGDRVAAFVLQMCRGRLAGVCERWQEARDAFRQALHDQPPDVCHAHVNLAEAYRRLNNLDAALGELYRATDRQPGEARLYHARAKVHLERGDRVSARRDLERAIHHAGAQKGQVWLASAHVELGDLKHQAGWYDEALKEFAAALKVVKDYEHAHRQRAVTLVVLNRHAEAGHALDAYLAVAQKPTSEEYLWRGLIHYQLGENLQAVAAFTRALDRRRDVNTLSYRGWAYLRTQSLQFALADFEEVLKKAPDHVDARCGRGQALVRQGLVGPAIEDAEATLKHGKPTPTLLSDVAGIYERAVLLLATSPGESAASQERLCRTRAVQLRHQARQIQALMQRTEGER
jgi:tetratricopeptide (TPR) repeat protein